jgi:hypothetical protein
MRRHRSREVGRQLPWQTQALAALAEFDSAKTPSQRMVALRKLQPLFAGNGARKAALRKCVELTRKVERVGDWEILPSTPRNVAVHKASGSPLPANLFRFKQ